MAAARNISRVESGTWRVGHSIRLESNSLDDRGGGEGNLDRCVEIRFIRAWNRRNDRESYTLRKRGGEGIVANDRLRIGLLNAKSIEHNERSKAQKGNGRDGRDYRREGRRRRGRETDDYRRPRNWFERSIRVSNKCKELPVFSFFFSSPPNSFNYRYFSPPR